jgi:hypothetical protein
VRRGGWRGLATKCVHLWGLSVSCVYSIRYPLELMLLKDQGCQVLMLVMVSQRPCITMKGRVKCKAIHVWFKLLRRKTTT